MVDVFLEVGKELAINNDCATIPSMFSMYITASANNGPISNLPIKAHVMTRWKKLSLMLDNCTPSNMSAIAKTIRKLTKRNKDRIRYLNCKRLKENP